MRKIIYSLIGCCIVLIAMAFTNFCNSYQIKQPNNIPPSGWVPDEKTAITIAEIVLVRSYGEKILNEKPFEAHLNEDSTVWVVQGYLKAGFKGGVAQILIQKNDCKVLSYTHGK